MKIKDIVTIRAGFAFKGEHFTNAGTPVIKIKNISQEGNVNTKDTDYIDLKNYPNLPKDFLLKNNDWVIAMTGAEIGKTGKIYAKENEVFLLNQRVAKVESPKQYNNDYVGYLLSTPEYQKKILDTSHGSAQANISSSMIEDFEIPETTEEERKRIANILSSFDNKIEILKKENKILEDIAENIFKEWFVKYNFPNKDGKPYRDSNGKMIDSELGPIPDGWRVGKLGEIVDVTSGKALPKDELKSDGQYPLLGANGEIGRTDKYLLNKTVIYTGRVGTLGNVFLYDAPAWYSDNTLIISPTQSFLYYIFFVLQRQQLEKLDRGSTQPLITQTDLKNILVVIPDNDILTLFNKTIQGGNDRITMSKRLLKTLDKIKTALLYKLLG